MSRYPCAIEGLGTVSPAGIGTDAWLRAVESNDRKPLALGSLSDFRAASHLRDRKMCKAVSHAGSLALVALEELGRRDGAKLGPEISEEAARRTGLFVSSPAPYPTDRKNYARALQAARTEGNGCYDLATFGRDAMNAQPLTGLLGLPNGVLCYGSILLQAKGRNGTYMSGETGPHAALLRARRELSNGRLATAVAGGYATPCEPVFRSRIREQWQRLGPGRTAETADGACFAQLSPASPATDSGPAFGWLLGGAMGHVSAKQTAANAAEATLARTMSRALNDAGCSRDDVAGILTPLPHAALAAVVTGAVFRLWSEGGSGETPAIVDTSALCGYQAEASGVLEIALASALVSGEKRGLLENLQPSGDLQKIEGKTSASVFLIVVTSHRGEQSCLVVRPTPVRAP